MNTFKEKVVSAAKQKGYTLTDLYPLLGYRSYSGFRRALEEESLRGPKLEKLISLIGPLEVITISRDTGADSFELLPIEKQLEITLRELEYLKKIVELKDEIITELRKQLGQNFAR